jgi:hypothetical protein
MIFILAISAEYFSIYILLLSLSSILIISCVVIYTADADDLSSISKASAGLSVSSGR